MSKCLSVSSIKGTRKAPKDRDKPREGSKLRWVYDRLITGQVVDVLEKYDLHKWGVAKMQLTNFYGMELVGTPIRSGGVRCIGVWEGSYFVPIERIGDDP